MSGQAGNFKLNVMLPLMAYNLLQTIHLLSRAVTIFGEKCIKGISANIEKCTTNLEQSLALVTALAKEAYETGKTVREVACKAWILPEREVNKILDEIVGRKRGRRIKQKKTFPIVLQPRVRSMPGPMMKTNPVIIAGRGIQTKIERRRDGQRKESITFSTLAGSGCLLTRGPSFMTGDCCS